MSLSISLNPAQVEERFARLGIASRFTSGESQEPTTTLGVDKANRRFEFWTPRDNGALTLSNIKSVVGSDPAHPPSIFDHEWYVDEAFMHTPCPAGRHTLDMDVLPESIEQPYNYYRSLEAQGRDLPLAVEVVLMLFLHYAGTGEQLLMKKHTWCADAATLDRYVTVGAFGRNGVFISGHPGNYFSRGLGICSRWKG